LGKGKADSHSSESIRGKIGGIIRTKTWGEGCPTFGKRKNFREGLLPKGGKRGGGDDKEIHEKVLV